MKYVIPLIGVFLAFVLGYLLEPGLRYLLVPPAQNAEPEPPAAEKTVEPEPKQEPKPNPELKPKPEPEPNPVLNPQPETEAEAEAVPVEEEAEPAAPTDDEIRQIMSDSIEQEEIRHFTLSQVTEWKEFGEEEIDGEIYQFGLIDYVEETSLGARTIEAKALIRDRKVEKWIWTRSEMRVE